VARAAKPAEPRVISAFLSFLEILLALQSIGAVFPAGILNTFTIAFRNRAPAKPLSGWTDTWMRRVSGPLYLGQEAIARLVQACPSITAHSN
jgi:hypothetical protein